MDNNGVQSQHSQTQNVELAIQRMTQIAQEVSSKAAQAAEAATTAKGRA